VKSPVEWRVVVMLMMSDKKRALNAFSLRKMVIIDYSEISAVPMTTAEICLTQWKFQIKLARPAKIFHK
jgi:hypothetical protein